MARKGTLMSRVADKLRQAVENGEYKPGDKFPSETELAATYEVSRPTLRAALRELEAKGLVRTLHGVGSFVLDKPPIHAGLERLDSITESIRATGAEPGMDYKSRVIRPALPDEAKKLQLSGNALVLELRRSLLADGVVVAYSYDLMPVGVFPEDMDPSELDGSIFSFLRNRLGYHPARGIAEIHAVSSRHVGWEEDTQHEDLYVLLDQLHFDGDGLPLLYSRTYFIEGRYAFTVVRSR